MKYIFLDVDGVLNSLKSNKKSKIYNKKYELNTNLIENLKFVCDSIGKDNIRIVLTSQWRKHKEAVIILSNVLLNYNIVISEMTENRNKTENLITERVTDIKLWLKNKNISNDDWLIIDDLHLYSYFSDNNFVHTNCIYGLTQKKRNEALRKLTQKREIK